MDAADEVADLLQRRLGLLVGVGHHRPALLGVVVVELLTGRAEVGGEGDEALLGAVVEVALDASALGLGAVDGGACGSSPAACTWAAWSWSAVGPSSARAMRQLACGRRRSSPTGRRTPARGCRRARPARRPAPAVELEEVELRRARRAARRRRPAAAPWPASRTTRRSSGRSRCAATGRRARWWAISFHRGPDLHRSQSRRSQPRSLQRRHRIGDRHVHQGVDAGALDVGQRHGTTTNSSQANGRASRNVISRPAERRQQGDRRGEGEDRHAAARSGCSPSCAAAAAGGARAQGVEHRGAHVT